MTLKCHITFISSLSLKNKGQPVWSDLEDSLWSDSSPQQCPGLIDYLQFPQTTPVSYWALHMFLFLPRIIFPFLCLILIHPSVCDLDATSFKKLILLKYCAKCLFNILLIQHSYSLPETEIKSMKRVMDRERPSHKWDFPQSFLAMVDSLSWKGLRSHCSQASTLYFIPHNIITLCYAAMAYLLMSFHMRYELPEGSRHCILSIFFILNIEYNFKHSTSIYIFVLYKHAWVFLHSVQRFSTMLWLSFLYFSYFILIPLFCCLSQYSYICSQFCILHKTG